MPEKKRIFNTLKDLVWASSFQTSMDRTPVFNRRFCFVARMIVLKFHGNMSTGTKVIKSHQISRQEFYCARFISKTLIRKFEIKNQFEAQELINPKWNPTWKHLKNTIFNPFEPLVSNWVQQIC